MRNCKQAMRDRQTLLKPNFTGIIIGIIFVIALVGIIANSFSVDARESVKNEEVTVTLEKSEYEYTGEAITPKPTVRCGDQVYEEGVDYTIKYTNNIRIGKGTLMVIGARKHFAAKTCIFNIKKAICTANQNESDDKLTEVLSGDEKYKTGAIKTHPGEEQKSKYVNKLTDVKAEASNDMSKRVNLIYIVIMLMIVVGAIILISRKKKSKIGKEKGI